MDDRVKIMDDGARRTRFDLHDMHGWVDSYPDGRLFFVSDKQIELELARAKDCTAMDGHAAALIGAA